LYTCDFTEPPSKLGWAKNKKIRTIAILEKSEKKKKDDFSFHFFQEITNSGKLVLEKISCQ
jgi:hypothetical protein